MMNPTTLTFDHESLDTSDTECKMIVRVEETDVEVIFNLFDENGFHRYDAQFHNMHFDSSHIPMFAELFATYTYADENVATDGWLCVRALQLQLSTMF